METDWNTESENAIHASFWYYPREGVEDEGDEGDAFQTDQFVHSDINGSRRTPSVEKYAPLQAKPSSQEVFDIVDANVMVVSVDVDGGDLVKSINGEVALHQELVIVLMGGSHDIWERSC